MPPMPVGAGRDDIGRTVMRCAVHAPAPTARP
jgi:hypothetical protein